MGKDKKILLYRIDEQAKNVIFVITDDDESAWKEIIEDEYKVLSFDDVYRDITEFRSIYLDYYQISLELVKTIKGEGGAYRKMVKWFDGKRLDSSNFFTCYYSDAFRDMFINERDKIDRGHIISIDHTAKESVEYINNVLDDFQAVMSDDWNFDFNVESEPKAEIVECNKLFIRGDDHSDAFSVADIALFNFFHDFSYVIHKMKLYVCSCKYCGKVFLGKKNAVCCDGEECQALHQRDIKNEKRRINAKEPYEIHNTRLTSYLSQHTSLLKATVQEDEEYVNKFKARNSEFKQRMRDEIERCRAENIIPGDEQDKLLQKIEAEIVVYQSQIEDEWRAERRKKKE